MVYGIFLLLTIMSLHAYFYLLLSVIEKKECDKQKIGVTIIKTLEKLQNGVFYILIDLFDV